MRVPNRNIPVCQIVAIIIIAMCSKFLGMCIMKNLEDLGEAIANGQNDEAEGGGTRDKNRVKRKVIKIRRWKKRKNCHRKRYMPIISFCGHRWI